MKIRNPLWLLKSSTSVLFSHFVDEFSLFSSEFLSFIVIWLLLFIYSHYYFDIIFSQSIFWTDHLYWTVVTVVMMHYWNNAHRPVISCSGMIIVDVMSLPVVIWALQMETPTSLSLISCCFLCFQGLVFLLSFPYERQFNHLQPSELHLVQAHALQKSLHSQIRKQSAALVSVSCSTASWNSF